MALRFWWALALLLCSLAAPSSCEPAVGLTNTGLSPWQDGILTFYGGAPDGMDPYSTSYGTKEGSCGFGVLDKVTYPYFAAAALSTSNSFFKAGPVNGCGQCFQIQCTDTRPGVCVKDSSGQSASVVAMIADSCPECGENHIDIQALSFTKVAVAQFGRVQMRYRRVACTPPADMKVAVDNFGGAGAWMRLSIDDTGGRAAVKSVLVKGSNTGSWQPMTNRWGATWELSNAPQPPLDFKIVRDDGEEVTASNVVKQNGGIFGNVLKFDTNVQFTIDDHSPGDRMVQAFSGPSEDGPAPSTGSAGGSGQSSCADIPPHGPFSCSQQKDFGKCQEGFMVAGNFCASTCGRCPGQGAGSGGASPAPPAPGNSGSSGQSSCADVAPPGPFSCSQQKDFGKCQEGFMVAGNFCASTCGRCPGQGAGSQWTPSPSSSSPPNPADGTFASSGCTDIAPDSSATCAQRKSWGQCNQSITTSHNYCARTCGRCGSRRLLRWAA